MNIKENIKPGTFIETFTGNHFDYESYNDANINIEDIAHALSNNCRFNGHTRQFYSVAQHSVLVSHYCDPEDALWGLLHDASEAYLCDIPTPLKNMGYFEQYKKEEAKVMNIIAHKYGLNPTMPASVKVADVRLLWTEKRDLMPDGDWGVDQPYDYIPARIVPLNPEQAKIQFINRFEELWAR